MRYTKHFYKQCCIWFSKANNLSTLSKNGRNAASPILVYKINLSMILEFKQISQREYSLLFFSAVKNKMCRRETQYLDIVWPKSVVLWTYLCQRIMPTYVYIIQLQKDIINERCFGISNLRVYMNVRLRINAT